ncbi:MAG: aldehyde ferredoxin oxidoreductase N-terminal domain-containing protein [Desulfomonilaceae bacterium]
MDYLSSNKILIVNLESGEITEDELDDELVSRRIGGVGITSFLHETYRANNPIVLGTGLLTGTLFPGSALGIISGTSPTSGRLVHSPFTLKAGMELKYTGFDYVVILGKADKPVFLWLHDGVADIQDASEIWGSDVWVTSDYIRRAMGDDLIQTLVVGQAAESGSEAAQVCINYWGSGDCWGFGKLFGEKNLKAVALRGMGLLEISEPEDFVDQCFEIFERIKQGAFAGKTGVQGIFSAMGENEASEWILPLVHRDSACYNTPYASNTFLYLTEDPKTLTEPDEPEPGFLVTDPCALLELKRAGLSVKDSAWVMRACSKYGINPIAAAHLIEKTGEKDHTNIEKSLKDLKGPISIPNSGNFSCWAPGKPLFSNFDDSDGSFYGAWWKRRQAVAYIFGIHPIFANMSPELSEGLMLDMVNKGTGLELDQETLDKVVEDVCS